jgi:hypothetical protein
MSADVLRLRRKLTVAQYSTRGLQSTLDASRPIILRTLPGSAVVLIYLCKARSAYSYGYSCTILSVSDKKQFLPVVKTLESRIKPFYHKEKS